MHCIAMTAIFTQNDHFFKPDQIDWKRLICSAFNQNGQIWKKWSFWVKIVVIAMQCNAILMKGTSLVRIDPCLSLWVSEAWGLVSWGPTLPITSSKKLPEPLELPKFLLTSSFKDSCICECKGILSKSQHSCTQ